jgi:Rrf2 family transcriptional regulator, nitric oxide-sensitive transcriptional repressor
VQLSRFTDLGLRGLMYLGATTTRASATEIADAYGVSRNHMMKVLQRLADLDILDARVGRAGGFQLVTPASDLQVGEVVRKLEPHMELAECFGAGSRCSLTAQCGLRGALAGARDAFLAKLDDYTLADLVADSRPALVALTHD